jgi:hypothetical protein
MGPPTLTTFERADRMDRQTGNRRELLLRKTGSLPELFQPRGE